MNQRPSAITFGLASILIIFVAAPVARDLPRSTTSKEPSSCQLSTTPAYGTVAHRIGKLLLSVSNNGTLGCPSADYSRDFFTGEEIPACEYPKGANNRYLYNAAFWIGAVVGRDTLVSCASTGWNYFGEEFAPDEVGLGEIIFRSSVSLDPARIKDAVSEEDYIMKYCDTITDGVPTDFEGRQHIPLNIEITQRSYAWSYPYAEDFILFDYSVRNIGSDRLKDVYMGIYVDADVHFGEDGLVFGGAFDDVCGFVQTVPRRYGDCSFLDTLNLAWIADNDGDPNGSMWDEESVTGVTATRVVRTPADSLDISFNWWMSSLLVNYDFGPRERPGVGQWPEDFRDFGTGGLGTPVGDRNKYYMLRNREFDYDQVFTSNISAHDTLWLLPSQENVELYASGFDSRYLLSFGPFNIDPGEILPVSFAYVAGQNFHIDPSNSLNLATSPHAWYANVDFSDLGLNAAWAGRVYDNPGFDTDGDGYAGKIRVCCGEEGAFGLDNIEDLSSLEFYDPDSCEWFWYEGDGVPDFRGAAPPPGPEFWLEPSVGSIRVRINGQRSETARDIFTGLIDFEGYRVYAGRDERESSYALVGSYDKEDYNKFVWTGSGYRLFDVPYTLDSLRCLYGTSCSDTLFDPLTYTADHPYFHPIFPDSIFYFRMQDFNVSEFGTLTPISKTYPDQLYPSSLNPDSADADELTEDGYFKYFEYHFTIDNLLPTVPYWISVTAFDFGNPEEDLPPQESSVTLAGKPAYANNSTADIAANNLRVCVYPNPYRGDAHYRTSGYEGRTESDRPDHRVRAIHFANLPPRCTIRIYSLDGDLVRELEHDVSPDDPNAPHDSWNMITRNTQMVVSGLYYWTVESADGEVQMGKLVIIM